MSQKRTFFVIGAGSGQPQDLTREAQDIIKQCDMVISTQRLADSLSSFCEVVACPLDKLVQTAVEQDGEQIAILVSGDTGFFSAASGLRSKLKEHGVVHFICGLNSMQMLCAKMGISYEDVLPFSLHGRNGSLLGAVSYHPKVFVLTGGEQKAQILCQTLVAAGLGDVTVSIGEALGAPEERFITGTAQECSEQQFGDLVVLLVQNPHTGNRFLPILDSDLERGNVPMTKQEVRWTAVQMLDLKPNDIVYDIGAGTGSVSLEMARHTYQGIVYALERNAEGIALIERNRKAFGCWNVLPLECNAQEQLDNLPAPDAVFIGGSGGELIQMLEKLREKNPKVRVVISAVSLQTVAQAKQALASFPVQKISQIQAIRACHQQDATPFQMNNPIYLLYGGESSAEL